MKNAAQLLRNSGPKSTPSWLAVRTLDALVSVLGIVVVPLAVLYLTGLLVEWAQTRPGVNLFLAWMMGAYLALADIAIIFTLYSAFSAFAEKHRPKE